METEKINKLDSEIKELQKELSSFDAKLSNFNTKLGNDIKNFYTEELGISKFIMEHNLKNIDVILDILKVTTSLSISLFIASLTTIYFNEKTGIIILLNFVLIILLIIFIKKRKDILLNGKKDLQKIIDKLYDITNETLLSELDKIKLNNTDKKLKEQKKIFNNLKK